MKLNAAQVASQLFDNLWNDYSVKVPYASGYARLIQDKGGNFVADHLVFRTLNVHTGEQPGGIDAISHLFGFLGYSPAEKYQSSDKMVTVRSLTHPDNKLPRILAGQLEVSHLPGWVQHFVNEVVRETPYPLSDQGIALLNTISTNGTLPIEAARFLIADLKSYFCRPWQIPELPVVEKINEYLPYCAWVLLHGNSVYRFSANINSQGVEAWPDLRKTTEALDSSGIPLHQMLAADEGLFRQVFTPMMKINTEVIGEEGIELAMFDYSSFGLTERGYAYKNGEKVLFNGFVFGEGVHFLDLV